MTESDTGGEAQESRNVPASGEAGATTAPDPGWYVWMTEQTYGPYDLQQLSAFLTGDTLVYNAALCPEWMRADECESVRHVLHGSLEPRLEWNVIRANRQPDPVTFKALLRMIETGAVRPSDRIRHETWPDPIKLNGTKLYEYIQARHPNLSGFHPGQLAAVEPKISATSPSKPIPRLSMRVQRNVAAFVLAGTVILVPAAVASFHAYRGSDSAMLAKLGTPNGNCSVDPGSEPVCRARTALCGCQKKGADCAMPSCRMYAAYRERSK